jgi:predicted TPR repeat methyltransferase
MKPFVTSSGDFIADRRADYAEMLFASGEAGAAAETMHHALELAPSWAMGWFRLGEFHEAAGAADAAAEAWRTVQRLDPPDHPGAALKLELAGHAPAADTTSGAFVETLFDRYAETFDAVLVRKLSYSAPELMARALLAQRDNFGLAVDLGCGTGLMGEHLRSCCRRLEGVDISAAMLRKARERKLYDRLVKADLQSWSHDGEPADLVTAADVFVYVGALDRLMNKVAGILAAGGLFAFSVERLPGEDGFALQATRRYAHSPAYVTSCLVESGLSLLSLETGIIRQDRGAAVEGLIVVAMRRGGGLR